MCSLTSFASSTNRKVRPSAALHPPRQEGRVDREAVPADTGPGREPHVAERLGRRCVDRRPDVDAEIGGVHRQLVDERDVDVAERVLEQLDELGLGRRRRPARPRRRASRRTPRRPGSDGSSTPDTTLGVLTKPQRGCPGRCARASSRGRSRARPAGRRVRGSAARARWSCRGRWSTRAPRGHRPAARRRRRRRPARRGTGRAAPRAAASAR